jgi:RNase P subunit RPR2
MRLRVLLQLAFRVEFCTTCLAFLFPSKEAHYFTSESQIGSNYLDVDLLFIEDVNIR